MVHLENAKLNKQWDSDSLLMLGFEAYTPASQTQRQRCTHAHAQTEMLLISCSTCKSCEIVWDRFHVLESGRPQQAFTK